RRPRSLCGAAQDAGRGRAEPCRSGVPLRGKPRQSIGPRRARPALRRRRLRVAPPSFGAGRLHARRMRAAAAWRWTRPVAAGTLALPLPTPAPMTDPRLVSLSQALPQLRLLTDAADLEHYGRDWTRRWTPAPLAIAL